MGCFHFLVITNKIAMNTLLQVLVWTYALITLGVITNSKIAGIYGSICLVI